jgi:hypothetical protein
VNLIAKYLFFPHRGEHGEWVSVIAEIDGDDWIVLTAGCELTEAEVIEWGRQQMDLIERTGDRDAEYPDMHTRKRTVN